jgi:hypothetical protein
MHRIHELDNNFRARPLLLEGYILNFTCARYCFLYLEFSHFYINQYLAGQTIHCSKFRGPI